MRKLSIQLREQKMANSLGTAWIQIKPSMQGISADIAKELKGQGTAAGSEFSKEFKSVFSGLGENVKKTFSSAFSSIVSTSKKLLIGGLGGAMGLLTSQLGSAISRVDTLGTFPNIMKNLGYNTKESSKAIKDLDLGVRGLPTSLDSIAAAMQNIAPSTKSLAQATELTLALNNALVAGGKPAALQSAAMEQFSQAIAKGKPDMMEWRSLATAMPGQMKQLANSLGYDKWQSMAEAVTKGKLSFEDVTGAMIKLNRKGLGEFPSFAEQAKNATGGIQTAMAQAKTAITRTVGAILTSMPDLSSNLEKVGTAIEGVFSGKLSTEEASGMIGDFFKTIAEGITTSIATLAPIIIPALAELVTAVADSITSMLDDGENTKKLIEGFVKLFVAVAKAYSQIVLAIIPLIPEIVASFAKELSNPKNAAPIAAAMGVLLGGAAVKTVLKNSMNMLGKSGAKALGGGLQLGMKAAQSGIAAVAKGISAVLSVLAANPIVLIVAAIAALILGLIYLQVKFNIFGKLFDWLGKIMEPIGDFFTSLGAAIIDVAKGIISFLMPAINAIVTVFQVLWSVAAKIVEIYIKIYEVIFTLLIAAFKAIWSTIVSVFSPVADFIGGVFNAVSEAIGSAIEFMKGLFVGAWDAIVAIFTPIVSWFSGIFESAWNAIKSVFSNVGNFFGGVWNTIVSVFTKVGSAIGNAVGGAFKAVVNGVLSYIEGFINIPIKAINGLIDVINKVPGVDVGKLSELNLPRMQFGGIVGGIPGIDKNPTLLTKGEYVIKASTAQKIGYGNLDQLNSTGQMGGTVTVGDIIINGYNKDPKELANEISRIISLQKARIMG